MFLALQYLFSAFIHCHTCTVCLSSAVMVTTRLPPCFWDKSALCSVAGLFFSLSVRTALMLPLKQTAMTLQRARWWGGGREHESCYMMQGFRACHCCIYAAAEAHCSASAGSRGAAGKQQDVGQKALSCITTRR